MHEFQDGHDHRSKPGLAVVAGTFPVDEAVVEGKFMTAVSRSTKSLIFYGSNAIWDQGDLCCGIWLFRVDSHGTCTDNSA